MSTTTHAAALDYVARGWPVVPLWWPEGTGCACPDAECPSPGKHPFRFARSGLHDATLDAAVVERWWTTEPRLNVGIRTGIAFDVLDLDRPEAGRWLAEHAHSVGAITPDCWAWGPMSTTGHGHHLLYAPTGVGNRSAVADVKGIDWRGRDGYIVAPPSRHASGTNYRWHDDCGPDSPIPAAPPFLVELLDQKPNRTTSARTTTSSPWPTSWPTPPSTRGWSAAGLIGAVASATVGTRNDRLCWAAHRVGLDVHHGRVDERTALAAVDQLHDVALMVGLTESETSATIRSGYGAGRAGVQSRGVA